MCSGVLDVKLTSFVIGIISISDDNFLYWYDGNEFMEGE